jgi:hypothetical protein
MGKFHGNQWTHGIGRLKPSSEACWNTVRDRILKKRGRKCEECGWDKVNPVTQTSPVDVDHVDGNRLNNSDSNLKVLCPNCHSITKTYKHFRKHSSDAKERIRASLKAHYAAKA